MSGKRDKKCARDGVDDVCVTEATELYEIQRQIEQRKECATDNVNICVCQRNAGVVRGE